MDILLRKKQTGREDVRNSATVSNEPSAAEAGPVARLIRRATFTAFVALSLRADLVFAADFDLPEHIVSHKRYRSCFSCPSLIGAGVVADRAICQLFAISEVVPART